MNTIFRHMSVFSNGNHQTGDVRFTTACSRHFTERLNSSTTAKEILWYASSTTAAPRSGCYCAYMRLRYAKPRSPKAWVSLSFQHSLQWDIFGLINRQSGNIELRDCSLTQFQHRLHLLPLLSLYRQRWNFCRKEGNWNLWLHSS